MARIGSLFVRAGFLLGRVRPLQPRVVLATQRSARVGGNLEYIRRELERRTPPVQYTVLAYRTGTGIKGRLRTSWHSFRAGYRLATARLVVVDDWFFPMDVVTPRPGTVRIQTWHGAGAFKKVGYSVLDKSFGADEALVRTMPIHQNYTLCLTSSPTTTGHYTGAFRLPRERFSSALGLPRTDLFFDLPHRERASEAIRARYGLRPDRKVLLYAPTYRGDSVTHARYDEGLDLEVMHRALTDGWTLLVRPHPYSRNGVLITDELEDMVIDASDWPDMNELLFVTDLLVTDYSSSIFEFALLGRPMAFFAPDCDAYERERGFYFDFRSGVPGPVFETTEALAGYVRAGVFDTDRVAAFAREWFAVADGRATERFVDRIVIPALAGEPLRVPSDAEAGG